MSTPYPSTLSNPCPFCAIALSSPPSPLPSAIPPKSPSPNPTSPKSYLLLSTPHVVAFLDHAPISRGHVLLATRQHREKLSDVSVEEGRALGGWMGVLSRAVMGGLNGNGEDKGGEEVGRGIDGGDAEGGVGDWNVVQNNGSSCPHHSSPESSIMGAVNVPP